MGVDFAYLFKRDMASYTLANTPMPFGRSNDVGKAGNPAINPEVKNPKASWSNEPFVPALGQYPRDGNIWTIHNKRYDMRAFVDQHPGGKRMIELGMGRNCTELFETYHSLSDMSKIKKILAKFYVEDASVGDVDFYDDFEWQHTPFYTHLKAQVKEYFVDNKLSHKYTYLQWIVSTLLVAMACACAFLAYVHGNLFAALLMGFFFWSGCGTWLHDGRHSSMSSIPWVNDWFSYIAAFGTSPSTWDYNHTIGHHIRTNMIAGDPAYQKMPLFRNSTDFHWNSAYSQHFLAKFLLRTCLAMPAVRFGQGSQSTTLLYLSLYVMFSYAASLFGQIWSLRSFNDKVRCSMLRPLCKSHLIVYRRPRTLLSSVVSVKEVDAQPGNTFHLPMLLRHTLLLVVCCKWAGIGPLPPGSSGIISVYLCCLNVLHFLLIVCISYPPLD